MIKADKTLRQFDIGIIGGGASGLFLANMIAMERADLSIAIFERNEILGKKLLLTGNGRCNFTNDRQDMTCYNSSNPDIAYKLISRYDNLSFLDFMKKCGIFYTSKDGYYYPITNKSETIVNVLSDNLKSNGVCIFTKVCIHNIVKTDNFAITDTNINTYHCKNLIIACGGNSYPKTGSRGDAYFWAKGYGLKVIPTHEGLVALSYSDNRLDILDGLRVEASVSFMDKSYFGQVQFTKGFLSGIPVLCLSRYITDYQDKSDLSIRISFIKSEDYSELKCLWSDSFSSGKSIRDILRGYFQDCLIEYLCRYAAIDPESSADADDLIKIFDIASNLTIEIKGSKGYDYAQVTAGGVALDSLNESLESTRQDNLYFIGEVVDVDGICGGYNLQWAYSSARCCADSILSRN